MTPYQIESQLDPSFVQPYTFTAREFDPETGLYHYRARAYDPLIGRFLNEDPLRMVVVLRFLQLSRTVATLPERPNGVLRELLSLPGQSHQFVYLGNNPINFTDPLGLQAAEVVTKILEVIDALCSSLENINCGKDVITACKTVVLGVGIPVTLVGLTVAAVGGIGVVTGAAVGITVVEAVTFGTLGVSAGIVTISAAKSLDVF